MRPSRTYYNLDELIVWDHPNSAHVFYQAGHLLRKHGHYFNQDCLLDGAIYSTERINQYRKSCVKYTFPNDKNTAFTAYSLPGHQTRDTRVSQRIASFRILKQILTYLYHIQWHNIKFELILRQNNEMICRSNNIKLQKSKADSISFVVERRRVITVSDRHYVKSGKFCRMGAAIELMNRICNYLSGQIWRRDRGNMCIKDYIQSRKRHREFGGNDRYVQESVPKRRRLSRFDIGYDRSQNKSENNSRLNTPELNRNSLSRCNTPELNRKDGDIVSQVKTLSKNGCVTSMAGKGVRKSVKEWNYYAIVYWLNRVNNGIFAHMKYANLRKHIIIGKVKGSELHKINNVIFKMIGMRDGSENEKIMRAMSDLCVKDDYDNIVANTMIGEDIPYTYFDPISYELMRNPTVLKVSGIVYEKGVIEQFIQTFEQDPITEQEAYLRDLVPNNEMKSEIDAFIRKNFRF